MPSLRDGSVANCPNTLQLGFPQGQTPGGAERRCTWRQDPCGQRGCMAWRRHTGTSLWWERSNGALPWGHWSLSGTHCHKALLVSTPRLPKTRVCCLLLQLAVVSARHNRLLGGVQSSLEVLPLGSVPGASSGQPLGCIPHSGLKPPSTALLPPRRAIALQPQGRIQPGGRRCSGRRRSRHAAGSVTRVSSTQECRAPQWPASCCLLHASCPHPCPPPRPQPYWKP